MSAARREGRLRPLRSQGFSTRRCSAAWLANALTPAGAGPALADMLAELAEAEAAEADALACAAAAAPRPTQPVTTAPPSRPRRRTTRSSRGRSIRIAQTAGLALAVLLTAGALTLTVLMVVQHGKVAAQRSSDRRFVDAARDGVVALLSIDHTHARADVQRVLDLSTGQFHDDFARSADDFVKTAEDSRRSPRGRSTSRPWSASTATGRWCCWRPPPR